MIKLHRLHTNQFSRLDKYFFEEYNRIFYYHNQSISQHHIPDTLSKINRRANMIKAYHFHINLNCSLYNYYLYYSYMIYCYHIKYSQYHQVLNKECNIENKFCKIIRNYLHINQFNNECIKKLTVKRNSKFYHKKYNYLLVPQCIQHMYHDNFSIFIFNYLHINE